MKKKKSSQASKTVATTRWDAQWKKQFELLAKFRARNGRWPKVTEEFPAGNRIGQWANRQRDLQVEGQLEGDRTRLLRQASFTWDKTDERASHWNEQYQHLLEFRRRFPNEWPFARKEFPKGNRLGLWTWRQRQAGAYGGLSKVRHQLLDKIRFPFELPDSWEQQYQTLKQYRAKQGGRWPKAREEFPKGNRLGLWCHLQRCAYKVDKLLPTRVAQLEKLGFQWSVKQVSWTRFYNLLKDYKKQHAKQWPTLTASALEDRRLIAWCSTQRHKRKVSKLDKEKIALLDKLGFRW
jgi:hypothetical protein